MSMSPRKQSDPRPGLVPPPDALDRKIMDSLTCRVGPSQPAIYIYDLGTVVSELDPDELEALSRLLYRRNYLEEGDFNIIRSKQTERYILRVEDPKAVFASLMIRGKRRRLRSVHFRDAWNTEHVHDLPIHP